MAAPKLIEKAAFNPNIKNYIMTTGVLVLLLTFVGIPLIIVWLFGFGQYMSKRYYESLECNLTEKHLEFKKGIMWRIEKTIPLENIQDLAFIETPLLKYFNMRLLKIETAGSSNPQGADMRLMGIENAKEFKEKVLRQREILVDSKNNSNIVPGSQMNKEDEMISLLKEVRDSLNIIANK
jgi:putative membrane protein